MTKAAFDLQAPFAPAGDQPRAIAELTKGLERGDRFQTLLGVTGSGKTMTVANVIRNFGRPTLVLSHNKTLAAQLYGELKGFFPHNAVEYFISYYDYYQPVYVLVDRRILFDVRVGRRDVRFRLVVVVVRDEVLDGIVGEEALQLSVELSSQCLVVREHERRPPEIPDDVRDCHRLSGSGHAEQSLEPVTPFETLCQLSNRSWLVTRGRERRLQIKCRFGHSLYRWTAARAA